MYKHMSYTQFFFKDTYVFGLCRYLYVSIFKMAFNKELFVWYILGMTRHRELSPLFQTIHSSIHGVSRNLDR